ncbi:MAG TPA: ATP synthase F1 subunit epsilon [Reyranella sp.]|nr:ATP synthase F1 subunit epsilon [Reyranella sp.]
MAKVSFRLVMPERELVNVEADMVVVPGTEGDFGVLHGHAPLISTVRPGVLEVIQNNKVEQRFMVAGGIAEVTPERCTVLADEAEPFEQVSAEKLADRERVAQEELSDAASDAERAIAQKNLAVAKDLRRAQAYYATRQ